jgi:small neutral amino acid transporter SnatA (MarC family)
MVGGGGLARDTVTRFLGLIVVAMGVQFALSGIRSFFGASGAS